MRTAKGNSSGHSGACTAAIVKNPMSPTPIIPADTHMVGRIHAG